MRKIFYLLLPLLVSCSAVHTESVLDHGGKSLDFGDFQIPKREAVAACGENLLKDGDFENSLLKTPRDAGDRRIGQHWRLIARYPSRHCANVGDDFVCIEMPYADRKLPQSAWQMSVLLICSFA